MPYKSDRQRRFMHARHPGIARRWDDEIRERREQPAYGGSGGHGRKVDVDKRGPAVAATAHRVVPRAFNRAAGTGNVRLINSRQKQDVFPMRGVVAPGRPTFTGPAPGSSAGRQAPAVRGPASRPGVVRAPQTKQEQTRAYGSGRAAALRRIQADNAPKPRTTQEAVRGYGGARAAALRQTQANTPPPAVAQTPFLRRRSTLATGGGGLAAGVYGSSQLEVTRKAYRSHDPEAARQRRLGAGVATTGIVGTALAGAGGRRAFKLTRALRSAPTKMPPRSQLTDEQARALETLKHGRAVVADRKALALVGGGSATGLGSAVLARHAQNDRNRRWT